MRIKAFASLAILLSFFASSTAVAVDDFSCLNFKVINKQGSWSLFEGPLTTKAVVTWSIYDPGNCITKAPSGTEEFGIRWQSANYITGYFPNVWSSARSGSNYAIILAVDIPNTWLAAVGNAPGIYSSGMGHYPQWKSFAASLWEYELITRKVSNTQTTSESIEAYIDASSLWNKILTNRQKLQRDDCSPPTTSNSTGPQDAVSSVKVLAPGESPKISLEITDPGNCISLVHTPPIGKAASDKLLNFEFWEKEATQNWANLTSSNPSIIRSSITVFGKTDKYNYFLFEKDATPINTKDTISLVDNKVTVVSELDLKGIDKKTLSPTSEVQIVAGVYSVFDKVSSCYAGGWRVNWTSSSSFTGRYSPGGCTTGGLTISYQVVSSKILTLDLLETNGASKAKAEAEAKAAAELKAKQEAEAKAATEKAAAELKAKQEAEAKAAAELKAKQEAEAKAAAELKAKQEAEAKAAAELKAKQEAEAKSAAERAAALKKTTITCIKGKLTKKVTAVKPKCPAGYKKK